MIHERESIFRLVSQWISLGQSLLNLKDALRLNTARLRKNVGWVERKRNPTSTCLDKLQYKIVGSRASTQSTLVTATTIAIARISIKVPQ